MFFKASTAFVLFSTLIAISRITSICAQLSRTIETAQTIPVTGGDVGPESFAFDPLGDGPYTGTSDGRIIKWLKYEKKWIDFATTVSNRKGCDGSVHKESVCGRTLGLKFNAKTGNLYICDAYLGLFVVGPKGGLATKLLSEANGVPFKFTNGIDIDQQTGTVYFTDSSTVYTRKDFLTVVLTGDSTGRFMKYDPKTQQLTVLLTNMTFPNGVAISKDNSFVVIGSTSNNQILKYSLDPKSISKPPQVFASYLGFVDNVKRNKNGEFWVGVNTGSDAKLAKHALSSRLIGKRLAKLSPRCDSDQVTVALKLSQDGKTVETLNAKYDGKFSSISEVEETDDGTLWIGSVVLPFAGVMSVRK